MDKNVTKNIAIIVLVIFLGFSAVLNVYWFVEYQSLNVRNNDLVVLNKEFGNVQIISSSQEFSPPTSMYKALRIALENDGWNATTLQDMTVSVNLYHGTFYDDCITPLGSEIKLHTQVTCPPKDYTAIHENNTTTRYFWSITVDKTVNLGTIHIPPYSLCHVDADTGEIIPHGPLY